MYKTICFAMFPFFYIPKTIEEGIANLRIPTDVKCEISWAQRYGNLCKGVIKYIHQPKSG